MSTEWGSSYHRAKRLGWEDIAQTIHDTVTMHEAVRFYLPNADSRYHRIPCPIHNGINKNFSYTEHGYKSCAGCTFPHRPQNYEKVLARYEEIMEVVKRMDMEAK